MQAIRKTYGKLSRVICFLFALHIFNLSIDPRDREPDFVPEDLTFNEIESITEFMMEVVLGMDNAIEEHDEQDENGGVADFCKDFYITQNSFCIVSDTYTTINRKHFTYDANNLLKLALEITSPPPKA